MHIGQFHSFQADLYQYDTTIQLVSNQSIVADYDTASHALTLYDRWNDSSATLRQVLEFIGEYAGLPSQFVNLAFLRKVASLGYAEDGCMCTVLDRWTILFSNKYPKGV